MIKIKPGKCVVKCFESKLYGVNEVWQPLLKKVHRKTMFKKLYFSVRMRFRYCQFIVELKFLNITRTTIIHYPQMYVY